MGTRHLICVVSGKKYKVAQYGQWDGYPSGQGVDILNFFKENPVNKLRHSVKSVRFLTREEIIDIEEKGWQRSHPHLSRDTGSKILECIISGEKELISQIEFAGESLFCEYAYVIDFDKDTFEVYEGFNKDKLDETERFYGYETKGDEYEPVKHLHTFDLKKLPSEKEFLDICNPEQEEED